MAFLITVAKSRPRYVWYFCGAVIVFSTALVTWVWAHEGHAPLPTKGAEVDVEKGLVTLDSIVEYLVETWVTQKLYEVFEDSKLAEFSARTVHLEESYQVLLEQGKGIRYQYFRGHHELVDAGMRDIFSAQIVRKNARKKMKRMHE